MHIYLLRRYHLLHPLGSSLRSRWRQARMHRVPRMQGSIARDMPFASYKRLHVEGVGLAMRAWTEVSPRTRTMDRHSYSEEEEGSEA